MNVLKHPLFIGALLLTASHRLLEQAGHSFPYLSSYLDDLACFPVVLTLGLAFLRLLTGSRNYTLSRLQVVAAVIYFSIMFEGVLPAFSEDYTRDPLDIIAYSAGALLFGKHINRKPVIREEAPGA